MKGFSAPRLFFQAVCCALAIFSAVAVSAQNPPEDAPVLISQPGSTRALTARPTGKSFDFSPKTVQAGRNPRITFFVTNLALLPDEGANAFRVDLQDAQGYRYPLQVLALEPLADRPWVYALTVRLHPLMTNVGDVLVRANWRGMASNRVRLAIGFESRKPEDDAGAVPTPMPDKPPVTTPVQNVASLPWAGDRVRFIEQSTFGPNAALEMRLRRIGFSAWLNEQTEEKRDANGALRYSTYPYPNLPLMPQTPSQTCTGNCLRDNYSMYPLQKWFFRETLYGEDQQLRRRVSWALGQIWVVSGRETIQPSRMVPYVQVLDRNAFGNYRDLMREMTLNPAMGNYLDMAISTQQNPNENYAREILQLFSIGLYRLNQDGTVQRDAQNNPIPTYDQSVVNGFTKVFTGWSFCVQGCPNSQPGIVNYKDQMVLTPANHDAGEKQLLNYPGAVSIIPAGLTADQDFEMALDNIFYHPNVAPFVSKILIQQLVTSNPTPAYVGRVAAVFNDNGQGIRGDLKAVVRAILLDPEARGNLKTDPDYGHLREPVLFVTNILRPLNPVSVATAGGACSNQSDGYLNPATIVLDQDVFNPPSVFNYYPMTYTLQNTDLHAPEFGIFSTGTALKRPNFVNQMIFGGGIGLSSDASCGTQVSLARWQSLAAADTTGALLVDTMNTEIMHGSLSPVVRGHILEAVQAVASTDSLKRARTAFYLVATAPQFQVQR
ncbi:MAG: DUF1800 family protein [Acidobacteria bacterium]|nr:DUF1800 family protein [Acidobacteriota bacterium]